MANKRDLKKEIKYVCGDLAAECLLAKNYVKGVDAKAMKEIITKIADLQISARMSRLLRSAERLTTVRLL
jgi:hypothetical protein